METQTRSRTSRMLENYKSNDYYKDQAPSDSFSYLLDRYHGLQCKQGVAGHGQGLVTHVPGRALLRTEGGPFRPFRVRQTPKLSSSSCLVPCGTCCKDLNPTTVQSSQWINDGKNRNSPTVEEFRRQATSYANVDGWTAWENCIAN